MILRNRNLRNSNNYLIHAVHPSIWSKLGWRNVGNDGASCPGVKFMLLLLVNIYAAKIAEGDFRLHAIQFVGQTHE